MYTQYKLPYSYNDLEPHIDALTMETHYSKHHAAYTKNLNDAVAKAGVDKEIEELLSSLDEIADPALRQAIRNNGGGYYNHNLYFSTIGPNGGKEPTGAFEKLLEQEFGSISAFQEKLSGLAVGQFGSGWAWLSASRNGSLLLSSSSNQDNPLMEKAGYTPILGIDVWEHAYYLKYKNLRADYVKAFYNVILWDTVADNYERVKNGS
ncbi:superoxide dismutase [Kineothrix sp. MB12-C1]|uniref:superoxide dismutase n=1 Tax=Kineothrix sp. MB12-C1 TaxID=3070215 RepID=UPI0027D32590|nr:superoxide dismutase [Kineothrix sp. MB12-C1]WMC92521.1 superoxide dismutase [Kineothrix sp. MB12-C1]